MTNKKTLWPLIGNSPTEAQVRAEADKTRTTWFLSILRRNQSAKPQEQKTIVQTRKLHGPLA